jgi:hypothetical protein
MIRKQGKGYVVLEWNEIEKVVWRLAPSTRAKGGKK